VDLQKGQHSEKGFSKSVKRLNISWWKFKEAPCFIEDGRLSQNGPGDNDRIR
jgi:hypothetical protein